MSDSDQSLEILIKTIADTTGITLTEQQALKLKDNLGSLSEDQMAHLPENAQLWSKYKNVLQETGGEALSLREKHHILHAAIHALGPEFEGLGRYAMMIFNPVTLSLAEIIGGWELWNLRIKEGTEALSGFQLPDLSTHVTQVNQANAAWQEFIKAKDDIVDTFNSIDAAAERSTKKIHELLELRKKLTSKPDEEQHAADQAEIAAMEKRRLDLYKDAEKKRLQASQIRVASADEDAANLADLKAQAEAAKKGREQALKNLEIIEKAGQGNLAAAAQYYLKFGFMKGEDARKIQRDIIADAGELERKAREMEERKPARDQARSQKQKLNEEAGKESGEADNLTHQINDQIESFGTKESATPLDKFLKSGSLEDLIGAATENAQAQQNLLAHWKSHTINQTNMFRQIIELIIQHGLMTKDVMDKIQELQGRLNHQQQ